MRSPVTTGHLTRLLLVCIAVVLLIINSIAAIRSAQQYARWQNARSQYELVRAEARQLLRFRHEVQPLLRTEEHDEPANDLLVHLNNVLAACGIPSEFLREFRPESNVAIQSSVQPNQGQLHWMRQTVSVQIQPVTLKQLGSFLTEWNERNLHWTIRRIEVIPSSDRGERESQMIRVRIGLSAAYLNTPKQ